MKRVRAGHKASVARIISDTKWELDATEHNFLRLEQQRNKLQEKHETILKLDGEIQGLLEAKDEVCNEIEQADIVSDEMELTLIILNEALAGVETPKLRRKLQPQVCRKHDKALWRQETKLAGDGTSTKDGTRILPTSVPSRARMETKVRLQKLSLKRSLKGT